MDAEVIEMVVEILTASGLDGFGLLINSVGCPECRPGFIAALRERLKDVASTMCRDCHDKLAGKKLGGNTIPQGHATGYPIYRLEWQSVGSLQRRLRGCMTAVRAEPYASGASELVALEAFLAKRSAGMIIESPAVRP